MKRTRSALLRTLALTPALCLISGCIFSIDTRGSDWTGHGYHEQGPPALVGSGIAMEQVRDVPAYHAVEVSGDVVVDLQTASEQGPVVVRGDDNLLEHLRTEVLSGVLHIGLENGSYEPRRRIEVELQCVSVDALSLLGNGEVEAVGVAGPKLSLTLSGAGDMQVSGAVEWVDVLVNGSGDVELRELEARRARVILNGSGDVDIHASEELEAKVTGSGDVCYRGNPTIDFSVHGTGSIRNR